MPDESSPPTVTEVAAAAGVSAATVSRVLTGRVRVSTSARVSVHDAIAQLGYVRHRGPRRPDRLSSRLPVAALVFEPTARLFHDTFSARLLAGAEEELTRHGIPLLTMSATRGTIASATQFLTTGGVGGVLLLGGHSSHPLAVSLAASRVPLRASGRPVEGLDIPFVDVDNHDGARQAVEHLMLRGRRTIATIAGPPDSPAAADRLDGYRRALEAAGRAPAVACGDFTTASGGHAAAWLLDRMPRLDALFVASDAMAAGALQALRKAGRRVPEDVAVVGFDDAPLASYTTPALTTVRQPVSELGAVAAALLLEGSPDCPVLPTELVVRASS
ncbi:substrate-binding domain-containing protein [Dactylosporangium sp. NBC_01737]|uniref:LacI family DNA-binding transcriptional regulator n=1 Tax=Dactylosporangium sp. NBC_01737 TaxID=2975959 RepID=UPI002E117B4F|nr:substrate-binding domain-containing protein [Dactylosporangium sp. NBC_01737]